MNPLIKTVKHIMRMLIFLLDGTKFWSSSLTAYDAIANASESRRSVLELFATMCTTVNAEAIAAMVATQPRGVNTRKYPFQSVLPTVQT